MSSTYGSKIADFFTAAGAAGSAAAGVAEDSLGGALAIAGQRAGRWATCAKSAFVDGMHIGVLVGAGAAFFGAIVAAIWLPARASDENIESQAEEFAEEHASDADVTATTPAGSPVER